jgi:hypothetical protein
MDFRYGFSRPSLLKSIEWRISPFVDGYTLSLWNENCV